MSTPPGYNPLSDANLTVPAEMVAEMAKGIEEPVDIARRYGFSGLRWQQLSAWQPFLDAVAKQRAQLEQEGWTFRTKAALGAEMLLDDLLRLGLQADVPLTQKLALAEFLNKVKEPKQAAGAGSGPAFSISIHLPAAVTGPQTIDVQAVEVPTVSIPIANTVPPDE